MKNMILAITYLIGLSAHADISLFIGKWNGAGTIEINGEALNAEPVELDFDLIADQLIYEDRFHFTYNGQNMIMRSNIRGVTYSNNNFYYQNQKVGELNGNKTHSDYTAPNGTRQAITMQVLNGQLEINKMITQKNGVSISERAILIKIDE